MTNPYRVRCLIYVDKQDCVGRHACGHRHTDGNGHAPREAWADGYSNVCRNGDGFAAKPPECL